MRRIDALEREIEATEERVSDALKRLRFLAARVQNSIAVHELGRAREKRGGTREAAR